LYGARKIFVGTVTPAVEQVKVKVKGGAIWVELSEGVSPDALAKALINQTLKLTDLTHQQDLRISVIQPVMTGQEADRRLAISRSDTPAPQTQIRDPAGGGARRFVPEPACAGLPGRLCLAGGR
jgi:ribosomal protein S9